MRETQTLREHSSHLYAITRKLVLQTRYYTCSIKQGKQVTQVTLTDLNSNEAQGLRKLINIYVSIAVGIEALEAINQSCKSEINISNMTQKEPCVQ